MDGQILKGHDGDAVFIFCDDIRVAEGIELNLILIACAGGEIANVAGKDAPECVQLQLECAEKILGVPLGYAVNRGRAVIMQNGLMNTRLR